MKKVISIITALCILISGVAFAEQEIELIPYEGFNINIVTATDSLIYIKVPFVSTQKIDSLELLSANISASSKNILNIIEYKGYYFNVVELAIKTSNEDIDGIILKLLVNGNIEKTAELKNAKIAIRNNAEYPAVTIDFPMSLSNEESDYDRHIGFESKMNFVLKGVRFSNGLKLDGVKLDKVNDIDPNKIDAEIEAGRKFIIDFKYKNNNPELQSRFSYFNLALDYSLEGEEELRTVYYATMSFLDIVEGMDKQDFIQEVDRILGVSK